MTNAWTKGPWVVQRDFPLEIVPAGHENRASGGAIDEDYDRDRFALRIASADCNEYSGFAHEISREQAKANARLIAAAPDMAEALDTIVKSLQGQKSAVAATIITWANSALAKARGEAP